MLKRWSSAFKTENCGDQDQFTSCRRYLIISYVQFWGLYVTTFQLAVPKGPEIKLPEPRGAPPHGTQRLAWSSMWVSGYAHAFLSRPKHGYKSFPIQEPTNLPDLLDPMAVSNQVVSLHQRLKQWTVLNKLISTSRTTSLASAHNFKNKPFPWLKWKPD